jgi:ABC-type glycerol-3-phosphate transport system substrate-binding protein
MYALGLVYNRALFTQAGLNPDQPPKTWDEVRTAAKAIADKTGVAGFADATTNNNGGWHLTAAVYSYGGQMEKEGDGGKMVAAFNDEPAKKYLQLLKDMRWTDNSMGTNHLRGYDDAIRDFAAGKMGMLVFAPDLYNDYVVKYQGDPANLGVGALPQAGGNATLVGGTIDMVNAKATKEQALAAMKWAEYQYLRRLSDPEYATTDAKARVTDKRPVGLPTVPVFNQATVDAIAAAVAPHVNVPTNNFKPFVEGTKGLTYKPEPPVAAQEVYAALDSAVQAILTKADADPAKELAAAEDRVNSILRQRQQ